MRAYLAKVDFQCFAQSREFAEFSKHFRDLTGITIALFDPTSQQFKTLFTAQEISPLCGIIQSNTQGKARCWTCNREHFATAAQTRLPCRYLCHAGLMDIAIPICIDGQHLATISCGQLLPTPHSSRGFRNILRRLRGLPLAKKTLQQAYARAPYLEPARIDAAIKFLTFFAEYLGRMGLTLRAMADRLQGKTPTP